MNFFNRAREVAEKAACAVTGKEEYRFGDLSRHFVDKGKQKACEITGKEEYQVLGVILAAKLLDTGYPGHRSGVMAQGPWLMGHGPGPIAQGPWPRSHGSGAMAQVPWLRGHGSGTIGWRPDKGSDLGALGKAWHSLQGL